MIASKKKLTPKQELFVNEYLVDLNATQACIRAGYSEKTAESQASRLLTNVKVQELVSKLQNKRLEAIERTAKDVVLDIVRLARVAEEAGQLNVAMKGFELEGKHHGAFTERIEMSSGEKPIQIRHSISPCVVEILNSLNKKEETK